MAASWQEPKSSQSSTSQPSRARYFPVVRPTVFSSVDQMRLSLMGTEAPVTLAAHTALSKWMRQFYTPEWSRRQIEDRHMRLGADIHTLQQLVEFPPAEWDAAMWFKMYERLESWRGQREAAWWHLHARRFRDPQEMQDQEIEEQCARLSELGQKKEFQGRASTTSVVEYGMDPFLEE